MTISIFKLIPIYVLLLQNNKQVNNYLNPSKINLAQLILINEGSHTRFIGYLNNDEINIQVSQHYQTNRQNRTIRYIWLETSVYTKITFARSLWIIKEKNTSLKQIKRNIAIGKSFIQEEIDINKKVIEIQYYYCKDMEKYLRSKQPIIGKKYKLNYNNEFNIIIQEFFSPTLFTL